MDDEQLCKNLEVSKHFMLLFTLNERLMLAGMDIIYGCHSMAIEQ